MSSGNGGNEGSGWLPEYVQTTDVLDVPNRGEFGEVREVYLGMNRA
jgi:hypothetical protein